MNEGSKIDLTISRHKKQQAFYWKQEQWLHNCGMSRN